MNLREKLYESKATRPLILSLDLLIGAGVIGGIAGCSSNDRANESYDHPKTINVDGRNVEIHDKSAIFDSLPEGLQKELYELEVEARQHLILGYGQTRSANSKAKVDSLIKNKRNPLLSRRGIDAEWNYFDATEDFPPCVTFKYKKSRSYY